MISNGLLESWLNFVGASAAGQMSIVNSRHDVNGVAGASQAWLTLTDSQPLQYTFATPVGTTAQCGQVQFIDYHAEDMNLTRWRIIPQRMYPWPDDAPRRIGRLFVT